MTISLVIPIYNERENVLALYESITDVLLGLAEPVEILWIDDGSDDGSDEVLRELASKDEKHQGPHAAPELRSDRRHHGRHRSREGRGGGRPMDGDGQNDPAEIPRLLDKIAEGYDVVSGWRQTRHDGRWRVLAEPSGANWPHLARLRRAAARLRLLAQGLPSRDPLLGAPLRRDAPLHSHLRQLAGRPGGGDPGVHTIGRADGDSKYGLDRIFKVVLDLMVVQFLGRYETKPIYVFGGFGLLTWGIAAAASAYAIYLKYFGPERPSSRRRSPSSR